jgi:hypothetical protein
MVLCFTWYWRENTTVHKLGSKSLVFQSGMLLAIPDQLPGEISQDKQSCSSALGYIKVSCPYACHNGT